MASFWRRHIIDILVAAAMIFAQIAGGAQACPAGAGPAVAGAAAVARHGADAAGTGQGALAHPGHGPLRHAAAAMDATATSHHCAGTTPGDTAAAADDKRGGDGVPAHGACNRPCCIAACHLALTLPASAALCVPQRPSALAGIDLPDPETTRPEVETPPPRFIA